MNSNFLFSKKSEFCLIIWSLKTIFKMVIALNAKSQTKKALLYFFAILWALKIIMRTQESRFNHVIQTPLFLSFFKTFYLFSTKERHWTGRRHVKCPVLNPSKSWCYQSLILRDTNRSLRTQNDHKYDEKQDNNYCYQ
jgi:hypothetical protein